MHIIYSEDEWGTQPSVLALGMFDGVHEAHQALIRRAVQLAEQFQARSVVCTFDKHPAEVLFPEKAPRMLLTLEQRLQKIATLGVHCTLVKPFTPALANMAPQQFLKTYVEKMHALAVVTGFNYTFGKAAQGNAETILAMANTLGFYAEILSPVTHNGQRVSSTLIRHLQDVGQNDLAEQMLDIQA